MYTTTEDTDLGTTLIWKKLTTAENCAQISILIDNVSPALLPDAVELMMLVP